MLAYLNLSGVILGMDARVSMCFAPDEPKKTSGFSEPFSESMKKRGAVIEWSSSWG